MDEGEKKLICSKKCKKKISMSSYRVFCGDFDKKECKKWLSEEKID